MFVITDYSLAVLVSFLAMLCWGSWANTQKLATQSVPTTLFYRDFTYGIGLLSLLLAFTLGSFGPVGRSFLDNFELADRQHKYSAVVGGVVFNLANILIVIGIELAGLSVAVPLSVGLALILGVLINQILSPAGNELLLGSGVLLVFMAVVFSALAYRTKGGTDASPSRRGIGLTLVGGFLMSFFFYFVARSITTDFIRPQPFLLTPYTALVLFAVGVVGSTPLFLPVLRYFTQKPTDVRIRYANVSRRNHWIGILGGMVCCLGMASSLLASGTAGYAISYGLGQGATIIAVLWGVLVWREFRHASTTANRYLVLVSICYVAGLCLIIAAR